MRSRKEAWLLALLALHAHTPLERSWLATTLWPDATEEAALYNLRRSLHGLREALGSEANRLLAPTPRTLRLDMTGADCDLTAFDAAMRQGDPTALREAAALYQGPLLLGCLEEWAIPEREARARAIVHALETLGAEMQKHGELTSAAGYLHRALEIDPLCETALRSLMETLAAQGRHAAAAESYRAFRRRLRDELNADPDPETITLCRRLRDEAQWIARPKQDPQPLADTPPSRLPAPLTALIGRKWETETVVAHLEGARLVTLTGTGGVGKTRLALAAAHQIHDDFPNGVCFADLAPLTNPALIGQAVLGTLGARELAGRTPSEALAEFLRPKHLLLILDNCEHLVSACAHLTRALLEECPALRILATSREILGVPGEVTFHVPSLSQPEGPDDAPEEAEAVQLFVARQDRSDHVPSEPEYRAIVQICRRLDGIPLAIELAAARTRALTVAQIDARLGNAFRLLSGPGSGAVAARHRTLRATLDWSWELLADSEKTLLARLSVFSGGWTLEAAEEICAGNGVEEGAVLEGLTGLIDKSLIVYKGQEGAGRYRLLETVRQYGQVRLAESGEAEAAGRAASWFLHFAEQAEPQLTGPEGTAWLAQLESEHDNLRAALEWGISSPAGAEIGLRLAGALERFWVIRGHLAEGRQWLVRALEAAPSSGSAARAKALNSLGTLAFSQGDHEASREAHQGSLAIRRERNDEPGIAASFNNLGNVAWAQGDYQTAQGLYEESLAIRRGLANPQNIASVLGNLANVAHALGDYAEARSLHAESLAIRRKLGDRQGIASTLQNLGNVVQAQGEYEAARALYEECLGIRRSLQDKQGIAAALNNLGNVTIAQGDNQAAKGLYEESLALKRELGDLQGIAYSLHNLGTIFSEQGDYPAARHLHTESLTLLRQIGDRYGLVHSLEGLADVAGGLRHPQRMARLLGAAESLRLALGCPVEPASQEKHDQSIVSVRAALGEAAFTLAWAEGRETDWEQSVEYAIAGDD